MAKSKIEYHELFQASNDSRNIVMSTVPRWLHIAQQLEAKETTRLLRCS